MSIVQYNARITQKHGTEAEWNAAADFVPLQGEIIIYDDLNKIKIGDGITTVVNLPFNSDNIYIQDTEPENVDTGSIWIDTSEDQTEEDELPTTFVLYSEQNLSEQQKEQVRTNIGLSELAIKDTVEKTDLSAEMQALLEEAASKTYVDEAIGAIPTPDVSGQINEHNASTSAHEDIRTLASEAQSTATAAQEAVNNKAPMYTYSAADITAGTSALETGKLHFVYE